MVQPLVSARGTGIGSGFWGGEFSLGLGIWRVGCSCNDCFGDDYLTSRVLNGNSDSGSNRILPSGVKIVYVLHQSHYILPMTICGALECYDISGLNTISASPVLGHDANTLLQPYAYIKSVYRVTRRYHQSHTAISSSVPLSRIRQVYEHWLSS